MSSVIIKSYRFETEIKIMSKLEDAMREVKALVQGQVIENLRQGRPYPKWDKGELGANVAGHSRIEKSGSEITAVIGTNLLYGKALEFGHIQHPGQYVAKIGKRLVASDVPAYPWLFPAVEQSRDKIISILKGSVMTGTAGKMTWNKFTGERMGEYMKTYGGHAEAIKVIAKEWKEYKAKK